jgi:hypothetical protein
MKANQFSFTKNNLRGLSKTDISLATVENVKSVPLSFHTGYLTIDEIKRVDGKLQCSFTVPNFEVETPFYDILNQRSFIKDGVGEAVE